MLRKLAPVSLLAAWLCVSGAVLDLAQTAAWARMFVRYAGTESLAAAACDTFDPARPCEICKAVGKAKAAAQQAPAIADDGGAKIVLILEKTDSVAITPVRLAWPECGSDAGPSRVYDVLTQPPRGLRS
ncbi:MAG TPA: hypothetical protein VGG37_03675 [Opitutaceae bacterium]|jgi:hypothetical protein